MSFFGRQNRRSSSVPPNHLGRSQSFSVPSSHSSTGHHTHAANTHPTNDASSFHGHTEHSLKASSQTVDDLNETIANLKSSLVTHATSNAETMNSFNTLQTAHDELYREHVALQEQMDDAVELLKYLKEEKLQQEEAIDNLKAELRSCREKSEGSVVSITIENLTKEKMELEQQLVEGAKERAKLEAEVAALAKIHEAYELQTKQTLSSGEKIIALEREREAFVVRIRELEKKKDQFESGDSKRVDEIGLREQEIQRLKSELEMQRDGASLKDREIAVLKSEMSRLETELSCKTDSVARYQREIEQLQDELSNFHENNDEDASQHQHQHQLENERLANVVQDLERQLQAKTDELASIDQELVREKAEMQSHLDNLQQQLIHYQEEDNHSSQQQQHPSQSSTENPSSLAIENEQLQYQIQHLESQLQNERSKSEHDAKIHAQLEREMQDRLAQRLALHLQESEVSIEARIREELEEEFREMMKQHLNEQQQQLNERQRQKQLRSKSFNISEAKDEEDSSTAFQRELEEQLRQQLQKVKEERERWQSEQEEFQSRVLLSKQQLDKIREGYRAKYEKEKRRANDLQKASEDYQVVIAALHQELKATKEELEEIQMQQSEKPSGDTSLSQRSDIEWKRERKEFIEREQEYQDQLKELQAELDELQDLDSEVQRLGEEKAGLVKKCKDIFEEHQTTLQEMEQLNSENEEFLKKIETLESAAVSMKETNVKNSEMYKELEGQLNDLKQSYDEAISVNNGASKQAAEQLELASRELESERAKWLDEKAMLEKAIEEADSARKSFEAEKDNLLQKLEASNEEFAALKLDYEEQIRSVQQLTANIEALREEKAAIEQQHFEHSEALSAKDIDLKSAQNELKESKEAVAKLTEKLAAAVAEKGEILSAKSDELNAKESLVSKIVQLTNSSEQLKSERSELETSLRDLQRSSAERIQLLEKEKIDLQSLLDLAKSCSAEIPKLQEELSALRSVNESLTADRESDKQSFEERLSSQQAEIDKLVEANSTLQLQNEYLDAQAQATNSEIDRLRALEMENGNLKQDLHQLQTSLESSNIAKETLAIGHESDKTSFEESLASLQAEVDRLTEANSTLQRETKAANISNDRLNALSDENAAMKRETDTLRSALEAATSASEASAFSKEEMQSQIDKLTEANSALQSALDTQAMAASSAIDMSDARDQEYNDMKRQLETLRSSLEAANKSNEASAIEREADKTRYEERIASLEAEIGKLTETNSTQTAAAASTDILAKELAETKDALKQLQSKFDDIKDTNVTLEEAIQDIQLEKEDIEAENEELANKLGDLTVQAKAMLARNEEMEAQLSESQMEYEDLQNKLTGDADLVSLRGKYEDALEIIQQLKHNEGSHDNEDLLHNSSDMRRLEEENLELKEVVDHLTNENQAAMEIKLIAIELKTKNTELTELLRASREKEKAAVSDSKRLREQLQKSQGDENRVVPYQDTAIQISNNVSNNMAELQHYKTIVDQLMSDRAVFTQRLGELLNINSHIGSAKEMNARIEGYRDGNDVLAVVPTSSALVATQSSEEMGEQIRNLTLENSELAQRLGGAVAEKEFALSTLSKLGAKLEELHERNKMLESIANLKSSRAVEVNRRTSFESSFMSSYERVIGDEESKPPLRDPKSYAETHESKQSLFQDEMTAGDYSVGSYMPKRQLDPEETEDTSTNEHMNRKESFSASQDPIPHSESDLVLIKVPGGEYYGQVNENGQKHGRGKMIYDNGNEYDGTWIANKRDGNGTTKYSSGNMYVGAWKEGKRHGFGVFHIKKTGDVYRGNWSHGLKHGAGVYEYADGELDVSVYKEDIRVGEGVRWSASRGRASRLVDGILVGDEGDMPLKEAERLTKSLGFIL